MELAQFLGICAMHVIYVQLNSTSNTGIITHVLGHRTISFIVLPNAFDMNCNNKKFFPPKNSHFHNVYMYQKT